MEYVDAGDLQQEIDKRRYDKKGPNYYTETQVYDLFT